MVNNILEGFFNDNIKISETEGEGFFFLNLGLINIK